MFLLWAVKAISGKDRSKGANLSMGVKALTANNIAKLADYAVLLQQDAIKPLVTQLTNDGLKRAVSFYWSAPRFGV